MDPDFWDPLYISAQGLLRFYKLVAVYDGTITSPCFPQIELNSCHGALILSPKCAFVFNVLMLFT